jgi:hypothetical protein
MASVHDTDLLTKDASFPFAHLPPKLALWTVTRVAVHHLSYLSILSNYYPH